MTEAKPFLSQTAQTASFAFRQYFRPLVVVARFLKSRLAPTERAESTAQAQSSLEGTKAILSDKTRKPEKDMHPT